MNQSTVIQSQFSGMTDEPFTYEMFEETRVLLLDQIHSRLNSEEKSFLLSFAQGNPQWINKDYGVFPGVQWKLLNINKLKKSNRPKHNQQVELLEKILESGR